MQQPCFVPAHFEQAYAGDCRTTKHRSPEVRPTKPAASTNDVRSLLYDSEDSEEITSLVAIPTLEQLIELEEEQERSEQFNFGAASDFGSIFEKDVTLFQTKSSEAGPRGGRQGRVRALTNVV